VVNPAVTAYVNEAQPGLDSGRRLRDRPEDSVVRCILPSLATDRKENETPWLLNREHID
jgi:hypothetical protein